MSRIPPILPGETDDEAVDDLLRAAAEGWYEDAAYFGTIAHRPALLRRLVDLFEEFPRSDRIDPVTLELMRLKVAETHQCAYCSTVRTVEVRDEVEPKERALFADELDDEVFTREERLAIELAGRLSEDPFTVDDAFFAELQDAFSDEAIVELLLFASLEVGLDRYCIALQLDTTEESPYPTDLEYPHEPEPRPGE